MKARIIRALIVAAVALGILAAGTAPLGRPGLSSTDPATTTLSTGG